MTKRRFVCPGHGAEGLPHEVAISDVHLSQAPESLLSIAASQSTTQRSQPIMLAMWPNPSAVVLEVTSMKEDEIARDDQHMHKVGITCVAFLQAVAGCYSRSGCKHGCVSPPDMIQALEYFNLPDDMWPCGLLLQYRVPARYDKWAGDIMKVVNADLLKRANCLTTSDTTYEYYMTQDEHGISLCDKYHANIITDVYMPDLLVTRLDRLAKAQYVSIEYGSIRYDYDWSFRIKPLAIV